MQIELAHLGGTKGAFAHSYEPGEFELDSDRVRLIEPPKVLGKLTRDGHKLKIEGKVEARVELECDRCLQIIEFPIKSQFSLDYVTSDEYDRLKVAELYEEDLTLSVFDGEIVDIDEIVLEQILLAVPSQVLCEENCKGLCPSCGANRNQVDCGCEETEIDPRWAELKKIASDGGSE